MYVVFNKINIKIVFFFGVQFPSATHRLCPGLRFSQDNNLEFEC